MDISAREIVFDEKGVCNFCHQAQRELKAKLPALNFVRNSGQYDVLIGLSGGVDSSYALDKMMRFGLRPLCFSVDTGWNKPEADENIMRMVEGLKVPFIRYTLDLDKFEDLQAAFLHSGVRNIEIPTDHILMAVSYELAAQYNIKLIVSGGNIATESIMPPSWGYNARDLVHIHDIYKKMTGRRLTGLPTCSLLKWNYYRWVKHIKTLYILDYFHYDRAKAEELLISQYGFKSTGEKHEENYFTWWFQNFYLYEKFGIDKRKAHYSSLINSNQMTQEEALNKLQKNPEFPELGLEKKAMRYPRHEHSDYKMSHAYERIAKILRPFV